MLLSNCPECSIKMDDLEGEFFKCPNCDTVWVRSGKELKFVPDYNGFIRGEDFSGDVSDLFIIGIDTIEDI